MLLANQLAKDKTKWVHFMMKFELGLEEPNPKRARNSALTIGISYFVRGLLPLTACFFYCNTKRRLSNFSDYYNLLLICFWLF
jgi:hypothetical protein